MIVAKTNNAIVLFGYSYTEKNYMKLYDIFKFDNTLCSVYRM